MNADGVAAGPSTGGWRIVLALTIVGALLGLGWGIADQPRWRATATVVVESDADGSDQARLERFAHRGGSEEVATKAAGILGNDVPGADLLSDVTVRPARRGGYLIVAATADAPDVAAAAADGYQRALVKVEGDPLALGRAAAIPDAPYEDRPAALWAGIGALAGLVAGLLAAVLLAASRRRRGGAAAPAPATASGGSEPAGSPDPLAAFADRLGARLTDFDPGGAGLVGRSADNGIEVSRPAVTEIGMLADRLGVRSGDSRALALTAVGDVDVPGLGAALAATAAGTGRRVLLVEADLDAPGLAPRLGAAARPGLREYLDGAAAPRDVLRNVAVAPHGSFAFVPAGGDGVETSVPGERFTGLAGRLARAYDLVVYVAAPIDADPGAATVIEPAEVTAVMVGPGAAAGDLGRAAGRLSGLPVAMVVAVAG